ncbi:MAG TPA: outer membrane beta-barrel protein [Rhodothermales bacterium]|nr:outer membrane beta-barrel protein [Rhodothermales bacterium]
MKSILFLTAALLLLSETASAQQKARFGLSISGVRATHLSGARFDVRGHTGTEGGAMSGRWGLGATAFVQVPIHRPASAILEVDYSQKGMTDAYSTLRTSALIDFSRVSPQLSPPPQENRLHYLSLAVLGKVTKSGNHLKPYILAGPRLDWLVAYREVTGPAFSPSYPYHDFRRRVLGISAGFGLELDQLLPWAFFGEIRYNGDFTSSYRRTIDDPGFFYDEHVRNRSWDFRFGILF